MYSHFSIVVY